MVDSIHNLDDGVVESFDFILNGNTYTFRHLTTDEMRDMAKQDQEKMLDFMYQFISVKTEGAPAFSEVAGKMTAPKLRKFVEMVKTEMGA